MSPTTHFDWRYFKAREAASMTLLIVTVAAYLIGSISFAVIVSAAMGLSDPRTYGSNNPGATNVLRSGNKAAAALTLLGDAFKGWVAVWLTWRFGSDLAAVAPGTAAADQATSAGLLQTLVAFASVGVFIGHLYPVFFKFKGGKGVATAAGALLAIQPLLGLATLGTWLLVAVVLRYSSLAALIAAIAAPVYCILLGGPWPICAAVAIMCVLLIWRHRANIRKLLAGQESRIGAKKAADATNVTPRPKP
jgi:glycerol-3-phosphate acyltransferase PlsY